MCNRFFTVAQLASTHQRNGFIYFENAAVAVDSSHMTASSSASWSRFSPPSNFVNGHVSTMWFMVCRWPQSQEGDWARPHYCKLARHGHFLESDTHTFNGHPLSGTIWVSRYQKGKTNLHFTEARDSQRRWHQLGYMQVCTSLQTDSHARTPPLSFSQAGCPSCRPTNSVKAH